jgi:hypothetical protein
LPTSSSRLVVGDAGFNTNWVFFGKPVLAVADARVVAAVDRYPDQTPNNPAPVTLDSADGNHVILRLSRGRYVGYNHLRRGSIRAHCAVGSASAAATSSLSWATRAAPRARTCICSS